jgi:hypothetical protein
MDSRSRPRRLQRWLGVPSPGAVASVVSLISSEASDEMKGNERTSEDATTGGGGGSVSGVAN